MVWTNIATYILAPKFKEVCCNIAKRSGLADDLYQELILTLLEKIESQKEPLLRAWENKYIDWYIVSTADRIFRSNHSVVAQLRFVSTSTGSTEAQRHDEMETEIEFEQMTKLCETELAKEYWYNSQLFRQYVYQDSSIRKIEKKTGIPRNSIHRTLKETRERLRESVSSKLKLQEA